MGRDDESSGLLARIPGIITKEGIPNISVTRAKNRSIHLRGEKMRREKEKDRKERGKGNEREE